MKNWFKAAQLGLGILCLVFF
jgi:hypothetical protein